MLLLKEQGGLEGNTSGIVKLNEDTVLKQMLLKSLSGIAVNCINEKTSSEASNSGES
jgi:hypothetical protein